MCLWNGEFFGSCPPPVSHTIADWEFSCGRNVVGMMQVIEKEMAWRKANGRPEGFEALKACKPVVALGAEHPLEEKNLKFDHFRTSYPQENMTAVFPVWKLTCKLPL